ncbi:hypothetical protein DFH11DRAFT_122145 [Phellopilus nigrolimitatus]|nr:hypothetical protein DFH11DRAFT_122145 [Phellopilus nigrolimitatus]
MHPNSGNAIPRASSVQFENTLRSFFLRDVAQCRQSLRHKSFLTSPMVLAKSSCTEEAMNVDGEHEIDEAEPEEDKLESPTQGKQKEVGRVEGGRWSPYPAAPGDSLGESTDAVKRYSYLLGRTDIFKHFVDMKPAIRSTLPWSTRSQNRRDVEGKCQCEWIISEVVMS